MFEKGFCKETTVDMEFVREDSLNLDSHPVHWFEAFLPIRNRNDIVMDKYVSLC